MAESGHPPVPRRESTHSASKKALSSFSKGKSDIFHQLNGERISAYFAKITVVLAFRFDTVSEPAFFIHAFQEQQFILICCLFYRSSKNTLCFMISSDHFTKLS